MTKRVVIVCTACGIAFLVSGCGTFMRGGAGGVYPGTQMDCGTFLWAGLSSDSIVNEGPSSLQRVLARAFYTIVGVVDLPISLATDTLLLPYDLIKKPKDVEPQPDPYR